MIHVLFPESHGSAPRTEPVSYVSIFDWDCIAGRMHTGEAISIPVYIRRIRMKLEPDPSSPIYIKTVWRFGYQLCPGNSGA